jgi:E3 ubiquitin-protein ligase XBAT32/33
MSHGAGCDHEFCTRCALYLCSTNCTATVAKGPPGSIACPLCRHGIVSFVKLPATRPVVKEIARTSLSLSFCSCSGEELAASSIETPFCKPELRCSRISPLGSSFRSLSFRRFPSMKINYSFCKEAPDICCSLVPCSVNRNLRSHLTRCSKSGFRRSASAGRRSWLSALTQYETSGG